MQPLPTPVRVPLDLEREHEHEGGGVRGEEQDQKILDQKKHNQEVVSMVWIMKRAMVEYGWVSSRKHICDWKR